MILTQSQKYAITVAAVMLFLAAFVEPPQPADTLHDHASEVRTPQSAESVRRWNVWLAQCQAKPKCRQRLDELMTDR